MYRSRKVPDNPVHFLQIWIQPDRIGIEPEYEQTTIPETAKRGRFRLVASPDGRNESMRINADAFMFAALVDGAERLDYAIAPDRKIYLQVVRGSLKANDAELETGDAIKIRDEESVTIENGCRAEVLLFDLP